MSLWERTRLWDAAAPNPRLTPPTDWTIFVTTIRAGGAVDPEKRRALSNFYREEFLRHLEHLESNGIVNDGTRQAVDRAYRKFMSDLDKICWHADFPALAETLLQNFDALTRLSELDPRRGH
jgi:hypothetical protein